MSLKLAIGDLTIHRPTPGHTPGHVAFAFGRGKDIAVASDDLMHSPLQTRFSRTVGEIRRRPGAGRGDPTEFPGALLRYRDAVLHRSFPLAHDGKNPAPGQRVLLRGDLTCLACYFRVSPSLTSPRLRGEVARCTPPLSPQERGEGEERARLNRINSACD
jgi:hypothetical protein